MRRLEIVAEEGGYYAAWPELPGCSTQGDTAEEALANATDARHLWIEGRLEMGLPIPLPPPPKRYSGRFLTRVSPTLHERLAAAAQADVVSLNTWVATALTEAATNAEAVAHRSSWSQVIRRAGEELGDSGGRERVDR